MNNTNTKQIIAGLPDESWVTFYNTVRDTHIDAAELKALAAAVPEWVELRTAADLPKEPGAYLWKHHNKRHHFVENEHNPLTRSEDYYIERFCAWMRVPDYQEDKDDIEEKIRKVTERGDAITGDEFERERR